MVVNRGASPQHDEAKAPKLSEDFYGRDDYIEGNCPECNAALGENVDRVKHSITHYGEDELRDFGRVNLVARQRQAFLLERPIPER